MKLLFINVDKTYQLLSNFCYIESSNYDWLTQSQLMYKNAYQLQGTFVNRKHFIWIQLQLNSLVRFCLFLYFLSTINVTRNCHHVNIIFSTGFLPNCFNLSFMISPRGYHSHSNQCCGTGMGYQIHYFLSKFTVLKPCNYYSNWISPSSGICDLGRFWRACFVSLVVLFLKSFKLDGFHILQFLSVHD